RNCETKVNTKVLRRARWKTGLVTTFRKFCSPTKENSRLPAEELVRLEKKRGGRRERRREEKNRGGGGQGAACRAVGRDATGSPRASGRPRWERTLRFPWWCQTEADRPFTFPGDPLSPP